MYRIMIAKSKRDNYQTLYQYLTTYNNGEITPVGIETDAELDAYVEDMLNNGGYAKNDFLIARVLDYDIDATNYDEYDFEEPSGESPMERLQVSDDGAGHVTIDFN